MQVLDLLSKKNSRKRFESIYFIFYFLHFKHLSKKNSRKEVYREFIVLKSGIVIKLQEGKMKKHGKKYDSVYYISSSPIIYLDLNKCYEFRVRIYTDEKSIVAEVKPFGRGVFMLMYKMDKVRGAELSVSTIDLVDRIFDLIGFDRYERIPYKDKILEEIC